MMSLIGEQVLLRIYLQSADCSPHEPTYQRLVKAARDAQLAGCTVMRGIAGFGSRGIIQSSAMSIIEHVPVIVECVDSAEKIQKFIDGPMSQLMIGGMATLERANVMMYRDRKHDRPNNLQVAAIQKPLSTVPRISARETMTINENGILLRVFAGESDKIEGKLLYESILQKARELGVAGATVLRGIEGFGANSVVHKSSLLEMSSDMPIIIEIADKKEKIEELLPYLQQVVQEGMITMEYIAIVVYRHNPADARIKN
jgi:PII-like signaling protein